MNPDAVKQFRDQLREAREYTLKDAEAFDGIIHVIERLGICRTKNVKKGLSFFQDAIYEIARISPLADVVPEQHRNCHAPFKLLYCMVARGRNDAMHIGAFARHLTAHAIELSLTLEDALRMIMNARCISDYMVRDPLCAFGWEPMSLIRQKMLTNSFSFLPVQNKDKQWCLLSDLEVAKFLKGSSDKEWDTRLATCLDDVAEIELLPTKFLSAGTEIREAIKDFEGKPILVHSDKDKHQLIGILTAFDLL